ncbi:MAG: tetratricopeptide repeat protein [Verrucomicrobiota bacterium]
METWRRAGHQQLGNYNAATKLFADLLVEKPNDSALWMNQAFALMQSKKADEAIANLEITRRMGKLGAEDQMTLGILLLGEGLLDSAMENFEKALKAEEPPKRPTSIGVLENLVNLRKWKQAKDWSEQVVAAYEIKPAEVESLDRARALIELEIGDSEAGAKLVEALLEKNPLDGESLILLAKFREKQKRNEEAEMLLEQAAQFPEFAAEALKENGRLLVERGEFAEASQLLRRSLSLKPSESLAEYLNAVESLAKAQ